MKNIFKYMIPCLAVAFGLTSCNSTMDDKAAIDAMYQKATTAVVTLGNTNADDFQTITVDGAVTNEAEVIEVGFQISKASDFSAGATYYHVDEVVSNFSCTIAGLAEKTTYYVRAYAATRTAGIIFSESKTVTTPAAPIYPLDGVYTATEFERDEDGNWNAGKPFEMTIAFDEKDPTIVYITNIWGGKMTVKGQYDEAKGTIIVPNDQVIYNYEGYGDFWIHGVKDDFSGYASAVTFKFTALGGKMESGKMAIQYSEGDYTYVYYVMEHK